MLDRSLRDKGLGKGVRQGRIWAYVRDQRPWAGSAPPGAIYYFAPDWKEEHVLTHLANARGILQADGYKGYAKLYAHEPDGAPRLREAACWAHLRRDFHDFWASTKSEIAREALDRIGCERYLNRDSCRTQGRGVIAFPPISFRERPRLAFSIQGTCAACC